MRNACHGNRISASKTPQMNADVTWETPISRPTSMIVVSRSSTTAITTANTIPRKPVTGMTYRRISPAVVVRGGPDAVAAGTAGAAGADVGTSATDAAGVLDVTATVSV